MMNIISGITARRRVAGAMAGCLLGGLAVATIAAPSASAAPDCSAGGVSSTVSTVFGATRDYLGSHPGANSVLTGATTQPRGQGASDVRAYFTAHPQEYYDLRGILAPIGDTQRQCNVTVLPPDLASAYTEFMAG
jgi:heme-binding protein